MRLNYTTLTIFSNACPKNWQFHMVQSNKTFPDSHIIETETQ